MELSMSFVGCWRIITDMNTLSVLLSSPMGRIFDIIPPVNTSTSSCSCYFLKSFYAASLSLTYPRVSWRTVLSFLDRPVILSCGGPSFSNLDDPRLIQPKRKYSSAGHTDSALGTRWKLRLGSNLATVAFDLGPRFVMSPSTFVHVVSQ
jgi:hypothetical protein